jgi:predicted XRE-type DNA-binding protein
MKASDVVNKKATKFTIDTLVDMLSRVGESVKLDIG